MDKTFASMAARSASSPDSLSSGSLNDMKDTLQTSRSTLLRGLGLILILASSLIFDSHLDEPLHDLWLPLVMAIGAMLALQNILAVALGTTALAGIHTNFHSADWVPAQAYPLLALLGSVTIAVILVRRFRERIITTRADREARRRGQKT